MTDLNGTFWNEAEKSLKGRDEREIWKPLINELLRPEGGPGAVKEYLEAEQQRLEQKILDHLEYIEESAQG